MTVEQLKETYLRGMPMADQHGRPLPDSVFQIKLNSAIAAFQRKYGVRLTPTLVKVGDVPLEADANPDGLPTFRTDAQPYDPRGFEGDRFVSLSLPIGPVREIKQVALQLPGSRPLTWQPNWIQLMKRARTLQIYPSGPQVNLMPIVASGFALSALAGGRAIPNAWQIVYVAGYTDEELNTDYADVLSAIGMLAAIAVLIPGSMDRFAALGISGLSASVDGLSNSTQVNSGQLRYAPLIQAYKDELTEWEKTYQDRAIGLRFGVL